MKDKAFLGASVIAAVVASFCCLLPIVFALTGITVLGAAAAFAAWRPYLLAVTFGLLGLGYYLAYRPAREQCDPAAACARPGVNRSGRLLLWFATALVIAFAAFPYYSGPVAAFLLSGRSAQALSPAPSPRTARINVKGMSCGSCAASVKKALRETTGVKSAEISLEKGLATIVYDGRRVNEQQLLLAINKTGFTAEPAKEGN